MSHNTNSGRDGAECDTASRADVFDAFEAAIEYFHDQLDRTISDHVGECAHEGCLVVDEEDCTRPSTGREYFERRGWSDTTIDEWKLGYAPGGGGLAAHLRDRGFADETLRATGLFTKNLTALWRGRYVLPYFDEDGRAVYAIARTAGKKGGGAAGYDGHPEDFLAGKYAKVAHTKDHVPIEEPIFGRSTLGRSENIVIAEGIADAITASAAGYSVLSPVTTQFKREHFEELLELVDGEAQRVFVIPDSERAGFSRIDSDDVPDEPEHIYQAINIPKVSPGLGGALRTANYLCENDVDARVVELPRAGLRKVDLDDYLNNGWADDLDVVLRAAHPPAEHSDFEAATEGQSLTSSDDGQSFSNGIPEDRPDTDSDLAASRTDGMSALWDLSLDDVNDDLEEGHRSKNPLGHTGDSENYFHVFQPEEDADLLAVDYKRKVRYNGLTYLLVEEEVRDVGSPEGSLSPEETWKAWSTARERGLLGFDDTIPSAALRYIADDLGLYDFSVLPDDLDELPAKAHNAALAWVKNSWWDDEDEEPTNRQYKAKDPDSVWSWQDVRYIYEESQEQGRYASRRLLRSKYDFMTIANSNALHVYDEETGMFTDNLSEIKGEISDGLKVYWSSHELSEIKEGLKQHDIIEPRKLNARLGFENPHICVENGVLDLFDRELKPHSPEYRFVDRVPVTFDKTADTAPYESFLDDLTRRKEDKLAMMEMVGHALVPDANERYKNFLILHGASDNGKTEFYDRVTDLLCGCDGEEDNVANVKLEKLSSNRFSKMSIYGNMANIAGEIDGKKIRKTATLKDITGGDRTELEPKGSESFFDAINATIMFAANDPPIIGVRDKSAISKRIVPIELPYTFVNNPSGEWEKQRLSSRELDEQLATDEAMSGFLNLALDGIERLEANGDVSLPESKQERLDRYESAADPMAEFASECLTSHPSDYIVKDDVTAIFKEYAAATGHEIGDDVHDTLHSIVKGYPSLSPGESRPRSPDYAKTTLPLRPWDGRKRVLRRITLTDTGLKHARAAGLVVDEVDTTEREEDETGIESLERGDRVILRTVCKSVLDPKPWLDGEGVFVMEDGEKIGYVERGELPEIEVGVEYRLTDAVVTTDDDGAMILELREGMTAIEAVAKLPSNQETVDQAVADGGAPDDAESDTEPEETDDAGEPVSDDPETELGDLLPRALMHVRDNHDDRTKGIPHHELVEHLKEHGATEGQPQRTIEKLLSRGEINEPEFKHYRA
ncbi:phage/plasmid primase, P4 family [Halocatena marina]|uniref:phage/plasmid primase, P4 family n=1 Tax=Halocatena marina TaxID=2934937 RepID=UPI002010AB45|nr:phage/plasmid primase, P4 family [Halocatena marina]